MINIVFGCLLCLRFGECLNDDGLASPGGTDHHGGVTGHHRLVQLHDFVSLSKGRDNE